MAKERVGFLTAAFESEKAELRRQMSILTAELETLHAGETAALRGETVENESIGTKSDDEARTTEDVPLPLLGRGVTPERSASEPVTPVPPTSVAVVDPPIAMAEGESLLVTTMTQLLKAHTEAIAAQTQATAAQHLPPIKPYAGEGKQAEEDAFDSGLEQIAGWSAKQQVHQLKLLLEKTALRIFQALPDTDRGSYQKVVDTLRVRFKAVDIEELRGMEFDHKVQRKESIEDLCLELQTLQQKAFPSI